MDGHGYVSDLDHKRDTKQNCDGAIDLMKKNIREKTVETRKLQGVVPYHPSGKCYGLKTHAIITVTPPFLLPSKPGK